MARAVRTDVERHPIQARGTHESQATLCGGCSNEHVQARPGHVPGGQVVLHERFRIRRAAVLEGVRERAVPSAPCLNRQRRDHAVAHSSVIGLDEVLPVDAKCAHQARSAEPRAQAVVAWHPGSLFDHPIRGRPIGDRDHPQQGAGIARQFCDPILDHLIERDAARLRARVVATSSGRPATPLDLPLRKLRDEDRNAMGLASDRSRPLGRLVTTATERQLSEQSRFLYR